MSDIDKVVELTSALDVRQPDISENEKYLSGTQPMAFLSPKARTDTKLSRMVANIPAVQVNSLAERLRVTALTRDGKADPELWADYKDNDLDQQLGVAFRESLGLGSSYAIVWDRTGRAKPKVSIESAQQCILDVDPGSRETLAAVKRWSKGNVSTAVLYEPTRIRRYTANGENATVGWSLAKETPNPLGVVPVVEFRNGDRLLGGGVSEIEDLKPLVDALNKILADMMVGSEFYARPRRWATGVEMETDEDGKAVNPFPEGDRMMISEEVQARFGSLPAADLASYEAAVRVISAQIMAVSSLPAHYLGQLTGQTPGADGLRAAEAAITARAESKQGRLGRNVEAVGRLMHAIRTGTDPDKVNVGVRWADPGTRSIAQESDAVVKLHQAGLLPADYALARLGYGADEIAEIKRARRAEALDKLVASAGREPVLQ